MTYRERNNGAEESSRRIYSSYRRLLEIETQLKRREMPFEELINLERNLDKGICVLQQEEMAYTAVTGGRKSPYYNFLLKAADRVQILLDSELKRKLGG